MYLHAKIYQNYSKRWFSQTYYGRLDTHDKVIYNEIWYLHANHYQDIQLGLKVIAMFTNL